MAQLIKNPDIDCDELLNDIGENLVQLETLREQYHGKAFTKMEFAKSRTEIEEAEEGVKVMMFQKFLLDKRVRMEHDFNDRCKDAKIKETEPCTALRQEMGKRRIQMHLHEMDGKKIKRSISQADFIILKNEDKKIKDIIKEYKEKCKYEYISTRGQIIGGVKLTDVNVLAQEGIRQEDLMVEEGFVLNPDDLEPQEEILSTEEEAKVIEFITQMFGKKQTKKSTKKKQTKPDKEPEEEEDK